MPLIPAFQRRCAQRRRLLFAAPLATTLLLVTPNPLAEPAGYGAWIQKAEQAKAEAKQRAEQAEAKARQLENEKVELIKKAEAEKQRAQQLEQDNTELKDQMETVEAENQRLEKQNAEAKRQAEQAEAKTRRLQSELDQAVSVPAPAAVAPVWPHASTRATSNAIGNTIHDCEVCPELVVIPPGEFMMGSPDSEKERSADEGPQHTVRIGYTLAVGKYEVTFAEWDACVTEGGCTHKPDDSGWGRGKRPVINVSWDNIHQQYLPWLNRKAGLSSQPAYQQFRLLTEAEWAYAARVGTTTAFSFGNTITTGQANYNGNDTYNGGPRKSRSWTLPVGRFAPNAWGLYDMHDNVSEWVEDCYKNSYAGAPGDGGAVQEMGCSYRVLRGDSWVSSPRKPHFTSRFGSKPNNRISSGGFRLARMLP